MSASTAIGMVSESLRNLLNGEMTLNPPVVVTILAPDESGGSRRINLFLYKIQENPAFKNMDWQPKQGDPNTLVPPPLSLNLFYLMTPYSQSDPEIGNADAHAILGEAMRVFHEHPIVPKEHLVDGLQDSREQIKIIQNTLDLEELSRVWSTFTQPFRLSVMYEISVVQLDMPAESARPMPPLVRTIGVPEIRAPFLPPVVETIEPASGLAGSAVTFHGQNLAGWKAYVTVTGVEVLDGQDITGDTFAATLPADLPPGFHQIQVDVSHLFRKTFFFEITT
jgi:hypothetical protein